MREHDQVVPVIAPGSLNRVPFFQDESFEVVQTQVGEDVSARAPFSRYGKVSAHEASSL
jgi:uncharacterized protein with PIN domain